MYFGGVFMIVVGLYSRYSRVEPRFTEPRYNNVLGITNDILQPRLLKRIEKNRTLIKRALDVSNQYLWSLSTLLNRGSTVVIIWVKYAFHFNLKDENTQGYSGMLVMRRMSGGTFGVWRLRYFGVRKFLVDFGRLPVIAAVFS